MDQAPGLPRWLPLANHVIVALQRRGFVLGTMRLLSVPGRASGKLQTTPVSPLTVDGRRYVVGLERADWVANARAAGWGVLAKGRSAERVSLIELPVAAREPILRAFPRLAPHGVGFFRSLYELPSDTAALPDAFAALAPHCPVVRVETAAKAG